MFRTVRFTSLLLIILFMASGMVQASGDINSILKNWNAVVVKDVTNIGEIEGRIFIGGNYSVSNSHQFGFDLSGNSVSDIVFAVGGSATTNGQANIKVFYGSAVVGNSVSNTSWFQFMQTGGTLISPSNWASNNSPISEIESAASYWKSLSANSTVTIPTTQNGPLKFNCAAGVSVAVFNVTDVQTFENSLVQQIELNPDSATETVIINVLSVDGNVTWSGSNMVGYLTNDSWRCRVLWNFYTEANSRDMGTINLGSGFGGALIAPTATVTTNSNIDGITVVEYLNMSAEIHNPGWSGELPEEVEECSNTLGNYVWHDKDVDGIQDSGEPGISGVIVELLQNSSVIAADTTDNSGYYEFTGLTNGTYSVRVSISNTEVGGALYSNDQKKWYATGKNQGSDDTTDSDGVIGEGVSVTLNCSDNTAVDFGFYNTCITINKSSDKETAKPGDVITYSFVVENCGDIQHHGGVDVYDTMLGWTNSSPYHIDVLDAGATTTFTKTYTVTKEDCGELINTVRAYGHPVDGSDTVSAQSSATVQVDCGLSCVTDWTVTLGPDSAICEYDEKEITINGSAALTPNPSKAYLQIAWNIVQPNDGTYDNSTHYETILITRDTTFTITATWPGVRPSDTEVEIHYGVNVLDCDGNIIKNGVGRSIYWNTTICNPPAEKEADVKIEKTSSTSAPKCGEEYSYTITVTNNGPNEAKGIQAADVLPAGLNYVSSSASQGTYDYTTGLWSVGVLANGASATLTIAVTADCEQINNTTFDFGAAKDYNLFVILDATQPSSDTQGKIAVGRNALFGNYSVGDQLSSNIGDVLIVGNDLTFTSGAVYNGNVVYGDTTNLPVSSVSIDGTLRRDNPINFATAKVYLENLSTTLSGYSVTGTTTIQWGGITLSGTDPYLNVFSVQGSDLSSSNNVDIEVPNGSVVLVNINGTTINWTGGLTVSGTTINNVLYNFYEATQITIQEIDVKGSILAPFAAVNFAAGVQNGQMMCKSLTGIGQFNNAAFSGNIPVAENIVNTAAITSTITTDSLTDNNSSSVEVVVNSTSSSSTGGTGSTGSTTGSGSTWSEVYGFGAGEIVYTMSYSGSTIYAGTWGGEIYMSTDDGENWTVINSGMNVGFIWSLKVSGSYIFAATEQGVYAYDGSKWTLTTLSGVDVHALAIYNGTIYAGTWGLGVYKSTDNGTTWTQINSGLENALAVQSLTINTGGEIYAGTAGGGMFKSTDGGESFTKLTCGYEIIWALGTTSSDYIFAGSYGDGLYRSVNGSSFEKLSLNVPYIYSIVVDENDKVYVSSWASGVYVSSDNGSTWTSMGLSGTGVSSLMVSSGSESLFVGTKEGKVYINKASESVTGIEADENIPTEFELSQNYPNPFNPSTTIQFALPEAGSYSLRIYNVLGQEVARLVEGQMSAGIHEVNFNASRLASGMYIYKLTGNNVNLTKKMMLMK